MEEFSLHLETQMFVLTLESQGSLDVSTLRVLATLEKMPSGQILASEFSL